MTKIDKLCPLCGSHIKGHPALSRVDNKTEICSMCGIREAFCDQTRGGFIKLWNQAICWNRTDMAHPSFKNFLTQL